MLLLVTAYVIWLQHINELSMKLDIEEILQKAEGISLQIRSCKVSCSLIQELSATCHGLHQRMQSSH